MNNGNDFAPRSGGRGLLALFSFSILFIACSGTKMLDSAANDEYHPVITHTAVIKTNMGDIEVELYGKDAPKTVLNFVGLAEKDVYDGILFHRIVPGFVVQAGDPKTKDPSQRSTWGQGGTSIYDGKEFEDELNPEAPSYQRGYVEGAMAMANRGPNTNTSQFFICSGPNAKSLPHKYTIFGFVRKGLGIVHAMEKVRLDNSIPVEPIEILDVKTKELIKVTLDK